MTAGAVKMQIMTAASLVFIFFRSCFGFATASCDRHVA
jgi:hypothetical protein